jgi:hypothetical protein
MRKTMDKPGQPPHHRRIAARSLRSLRAAMLLIGALLLTSLLLVDIRIADSYQSIWLRVVNVGILHNENTGHLWLLQKPGQNFRMQRLDLDAAE